MDAEVVIARVKAWVKKHVIPTNAIQIPFPRNQLAGDVQQSLTKADNSANVVGDHISDDKRHISTEDRVKWDAGGSGSGTMNHAALTNLGFSESGHTGFASQAALNTEIEKINKSISELETSEYKPPADGIPRDDLAQGVRDSLTRADSALQNASQFAASVHDHFKSNITDFAHTHLQSEVTGLETALLGIADLIPAQKGVAGTYTQGVDFDNGVITFQQWLDANLNNRWFSGNVTVVINTAIMTDIVIRNVIFGATATVRNTLNISASAQIGNNVMIHNINSGVVLRNTSANASMTFCAGLLLSVVEMLDIPASNNINITNTANVETSAFCVIRSGSVLSAENISINANADLRVIGTLSTTGMLNVLGRLLIEVTGDVSFGTLTSNIGVVVDNRPGRPLETYARNSANPIVQGVAGTYTQGVHFDGTGLPTFQQFIDSNINNRWFDDNITIVCNEPNATTNIVFKNISIPAHLTGGAILIEAYAQVARILSFTDCRCLVSIITNMSGNTNTIVADSVQTRGVNTLEFHGTQIYAHAHGGTTIRANTLTAFASGGTYTFGTSGTNAFSPQAGNLRVLAGATLNVNVLGGNATINVDIDGKLEYNTLATTFVGIIIDGNDNGADNLTTFTRRSERPMLQGVNRTYTQGVDFDDFQAFLNEHINNRWFLMGALTINLNVANTGNIHLHNIMKPAGHAMIINSTVQIAGELRMAACVCAIQIHVTAPIICTSLRLDAVSRLGVSGTGDCGWFTLYEGRFLPGNANGSNITFNNAANDCLTQNSLMSINMANSRVHFQRLHVGAGSAFGLGANTALDTITIGTLEVWGQINDSRPNGTLTTYQHNLTVPQTLTPAQQAQARQNIGVTPAGAAMYFIPDYANAESINKISASGGSWTVDRFGFIRAGVTSGSIGWLTISINGLPMFRAGPNDSASATASPMTWLPVKIGDVVTMTSNAPLFCHYIRPLQ